MTGLFALLQVRPPGPKKEGIISKFFGKARKDPFVPIGALLTGGVLGGGLWSMYLNNASLSQRFMRARIVAQGATVVMLCAGGWVKQ